MPFTHHPRHRHQDGPDGGGKHVLRQRLLPRIVEFGDARPASITSSVISISLRVARLFFLVASYSNFSSHSSLFSLGGEGS